jgi:alkyldihydroxyacetonephosphate synthase
MDWSGSLAERTATPASAVAAPRAGGLPAAPPMRWWGWGETRHAPPPSAHTLELLRETVGLADRPRPPVALGAVRLAPGRLPAAAADALRAIVGSDGVREDHRERVLHAAGKGYLDLVRLRSGAPAGAPDAVVLPVTDAQIRAVLEACARHGLAVVPFGGGTSVVGGVEPLRGAHGAVIALDMRRVAGFSLDRDSQIATVGAGLRAPALERMLAPVGLTLGHWPQSFEYVSLGGCAATRSSGQASSGYGGIAKMVLGLRLLAPAGEIELPAMPASAAGPGLRELIVGSEGACGVIDQLALRVRRAPEERRYVGAMFESLSCGLSALRAMAQEHTLPDVARLSDPAETRISLALAGGDGGVKAKLGQAYLRARGYGEGADERCLAIFGFEGTAADAATRRALALARARAHGALVLGGSPGRAWLRSRFQAPYLRDELLTHGVMVETLETATPWSNVTRLHGALTGAIARALEQQGTPGIVMCHVSHVYETGASLYCTFIARQLPEAESEQWHAVKRAASEAIIASGGTITHHHAIGRDHTPWLTRELGERGVAAIAALKAELDPAGIMNPGKLLPG